MDANTERLLFRILYAILMRLIRMHTDNNPNIIMPEVTALEREVTETIRDRYFR